MNFLLVGTYLAYPKTVLLRDVVRVPKTCDETDLPGERSWGSYSRDYHLHLDVNCSHLVYCQTSILIPLAHPIICHWEDSQTPRSTGCRPSGFDEWLLSCEWGYPRTCTWRCCGPCATCIHKCGSTRRGHTSWAISSSRSNCSPCLERGQVRGFLVVA